MLPPILYTVCNNCSQVRRRLGRYMCQLAGHFRRLYLTAWHEINDSHPAGCTTQTADTHAGLHHPALLVVAMSAGNVSAVSRQ